MIGIAGTRSSRRARSWQQYERSRCSSFRAPNRRRAQFQERALWSSFGRAKILVNFRGLARQKDQRRDGKFLTPQQRDWLEHQLAMERQAASARQAGHGSIWSVLTNKYVLLFAVIYAGSSATSNTLSLWMPQILKSFGLGNMETGLLNMIPFGIASVFIVRRQRL
jgi:hypothetical protein